MIGEIVTGTLKLFVVVAAAALYNHYAPGKTPESQFKTAEVYPQPKPADIREALSLVDGKALPKDYESKLFIFGDDMLKTIKTGDKETGDIQAQPLNNFAQAVKEQNIKSFREVMKPSSILSKPGKLTSQKIDNLHLKAVYLFAFNHKAIGKACLNSDQKCDINELTSTTDSQPEQMTREEESHSATVDAQYDQMFFYDKFTRDEAMGTISGNRAKSGFEKLLSLKDDVDSGLVRQSLIDLALKALTKSGSSKINNPAPAFGYKVLYILSDHSGKNIHLTLAVATVNLSDFDPEQLSDLYKSLTGKQIKQHMLEGYLQ